MLDLQSIVSLARETPNRGSVHIFLGDPAADLCDTTTVEPGNTYSPGVWTCGISLWLVVGDQVATPDRLPADEIAWGFAREHGLPPLVRAEYSADGVHVTHDLCHLGTEGAEGVDFNRVKLQAPNAQPITLYLVVRGVGPAGGVIKHLTWSDQDATLTINDGAALCVEAPSMSCWIDEGGEAAAPIALIHTTLTLQPDTPVELRFRTEHGFDDRGFVRPLPKGGQYSGMRVEEGFTAAGTNWERALPARVFAPDPRVQQVWEASAYHTLAAMELNLPRIGAINYPIFWMRDGIIILRALDLIGRHDLARTGNDYLAPLDFSGGFGAESDAPGEGIWTLANHARLNPDPKWLSSVFPHIARRVGWLQRMRRATHPLRAMVENRTAPTYNTPGSTILCLPATNGCIHGRMDWHSPDFYINSWALAGYRLATWAAEQLGKPEAGTWRAEADVLEEAMVAHLLPKYGNERDPVVAPYPTGALSHTPYRAKLRDRFISWYRQHRLDEAGRRNPELLWTYFEAAQIHNALLLGYKDEAWTCLDGMLDDACRPWMIAAWIEGPPGGGEGLPFRNDAGARGWLRKDTAVGGNMPHNWTSAEMLALLRTLFVHEEGDMLVLGLGVPASWLVPGAKFGVTDLPTELGPVSYTVTVSANGEPQLEYSGPKNYRCTWI